MSVKKPKTETAIVPTVPLEEALAEVTALVREVEEAEGDASDALVAAWGDALSDMRAAVDRRIMALRMLEGIRTQTQGLRDTLKRRLETLDRAEDTLKARARATIHEHPDLTLEGTLGRFAIEHVGGKLAVRWSPEHYRALGSVSFVTLAPTAPLTPELAMYMRQEVVDVFDKAAYEEDLRNGRVKSDPFVAWLEPRATTVRLR